jgi:tetratricopeptide (TPR) repeat protein
MQINLRSADRKLFCIGGAFLLAAVYLALVSREFLAAHFASVPEIASLRSAVRMEPMNAEYHQRLARYFFLADHDVTSALAAYESAVRLNPYDANLWLGLASVQQVLGNPVEQEKALERAIVANPRSTNVAWEAANLYLARGETDKAFREFRTVIENSPLDADAALRLCLRVAPSVDTIIQEALPSQPGAYVILLDLLTAKNDTAGAAKVWAGLVQMNKPFEERYAFEYIKYLLSQRQVEPAQLAWRQTTNLFGLPGYQSSADNLIVNPNFDFKILNQGFDWQYTKQPGVTLALDPADFHAGRRSLSISFEGPGVNDAGVFQVIPVRPDTSYEFSAFFKSAEIQGAGGPRFAFQDAYTNTTLLLSDELKNAGVWREAGGGFKTDPETKLIALRILRVPAGNAIRGKLWVGDFRLIEKKKQPS